MARFWTGPYVWANAGGVSGWRLPVGAQGSLDLRAAPQRVNGPVAQGVGFFVTANATNLGAGYTNWGQATTLAGVTLSAAQQTSWRNLFSLPNALGGSTLARALREVLLDQADPTGQSRPEPLDCTAARVWEFWLAGQLVVSVPFDNFAAAGQALRDRLREIYRVIRQRCLDGTLPPEHYRKVLGSWVQKYQVPYRVLEPADLPDEPPLPPTTTITDNFNTTNSTTLGAQLSWTHLIGHIDNDTNRARVQSDATDSIATATTDLSGSDHYAQAKVSTGVDASGFLRSGPVVRNDGVNTTAYVAFLAWDAGEVQLWKIESGSYTQIGTGVGVSISQGTTNQYTVKLTANGSTISVDVDGVNKISQTDSSITSGTRGGLRQYATADTGAERVDADDFEAADLGAAGQPTIRRFGGCRYAAVNPVGPEGMGIF